MITLEQFRATGRSVDDISDYNGADNDPGRGIPGLIYMDGTLSIERWKDGWLLRIGSEQTASPFLGPLERELYDWAKDEYGTMFDTEYRVPPCPINPTEVQMREWLHEMVDRGLMFHPDDDPAEIITGIEGTPLFHDNECEALCRIVKGLLGLHGDRVYEVGNEVLGIGREDVES